MTEYDFSPEGYERARQKHDSVSRWVDSTKQHEPQNPFLPIPGEQRASSFYSAPPTPPRASRSPTTYPIALGGYKAPSRSYSMPPPMAARTQTTQSYAPQQQYTVYANGQYYSYPASTYTSPMASPPAQTQYSYSYSQPTAHSSSRTVRSTASHQYYQPAASQPLVVPIHGGTGGYVVVPAAGQKVQIIPGTQYAPVMTVKSDHGGQSFLGSFKTGKKSKKKSRNSRRDSY